MSPCWRPRALHYRDRPSVGAVVVWASLIGLVAGLAGSWAGYLWGFV